MGTPRVTDSPLRPKSFLLSYTAKIGLILRDETDRSPRHRFPRHITRDKRTATPPVRAKRPVRMRFAARWFFYSCTVVQVVQVVQAKYAGDQPRLPCPLPLRERIRSLESAAI